MPASPRPHREPASRRSVLRLGAGLAAAAGSGLLAAGPDLIAAGPAAAKQTGTPLCDNPGDSVNTWQPASGHDGSLMAGVAYSDDYGVTWQDYPYHWAGDAQGINQSLYMMWSFAGIDPDGWLYIFSKRWNGSHLNAGDGGAIQLFRIRPPEFRAGNFGAQQNWAYPSGAWQWTTAAPPSIILSGDNIGEFSVKRIGTKYCMSCFDVTDLAITTRTAPRPDAVWTAAKRQVAVNVPNPYGGYIHPGSASARSLTLIVSQWDGQLNQPPYWALQYDGIAP